MLIVDGESAFAQKYFSKKWPSNCPCLYDNCLQLLVRPDNCAREIPYYFMNLRIDVWMAESSKHKKNSKTTKLRKHKTRKWRRVSKYSITAISRDTKQHLSIIQSILLFFGFHFHFRFDYFIFIKN